MKKIIVAMCVLIAGVALAGNNESPKAVLNTLQVKAIQDHINSLEWRVRILESRPSTVGHITVLPRLRSRPYLQLWITDEEMLKQMKAAEPELKKGDNDGK